MASLISGSWRISGGTWFNTRAVFLGCATEFVVSKCYVGHSSADLVLLHCPR